MAVKFNAKKMIVLNSGDFQKAIDGDLNIQCQFGAMYQKGIGVKQDDSRAVYWYVKCAEQGSATCQVNLARMYKLGVEENLKRAFFWYHKAAIQGVADAQFNIAFMYEQGTGGITQNSIEAMRWYRLASAQGFALPLDFLKPKLTLINRFN